MMIIRCTYGLKGISCGIGSCNSSYKVKIAKWRYILCRLPCTPPPSHSSVCHPSHWYLYLFMHPLQYIYVWPTASQGLLSFYPHFAHVLDLQTVCWCGYIPRQWPAVHICAFQLKDSQNDQSHSVTVFSRCVLPFKMTFQLRLHSNQHLQVFTKD